jgi:hypothetical protein
MSSTDDGQDRGHRLRPAIEMASRLARKLIRQALSVRVALLKNWQFCVTFTGSDA